MSKPFTWRQLRDTLNAMDDSQLDKCVAMEIQGNTTENDINGFYIIDGLGYCKDDTANTELTLISDWTPKHFKEAPKPDETESFKYPPNWPKK